MALKIFTGDSEVCEAPTQHDREAARQLVDDYLSETNEAYKNLLLFDIRPKDYESGRRILDASREQQVAVVLDAATRLAQLRDPDFSGLFPLRFVLSALLRKNLPFDHSSIERLLLILRVERSWWSLSPVGVLRALETYVDRHGMTKALRDQLESLQADFNSCSAYAEQRKIGQRIATFLEGERQKPIPFDLNTGEAWTDALLVELGKLDDDARVLWQSFFSHAATAKSSKPSKKWLKTAATLIESIGERAFVSITIKCLAAVGRPGAIQQILHGGWTHHTDPTQIHDTHANLLRGLIWATCRTPDEELIGAIGTAAEMCFKKIPNIGPRSPKIGNACLVALSEMNQISAVAQISRIKTRAKHASIRKQLAKALARAADQLGMTEDDLEELAVPTFDFGEVGRYQEQMGDFTADLTILDNSKTQLRWLKPNGTAQKTVPAAIKESHADRIKQLKRRAKDIDKLLPALRDRVEQLFWKKRTWAFSDFRQRFLDHPLVGTIARRMIWRFRDEDHVADGVWHDGRFVDAEEGELDWIGDTTNVAVWHPILSDTDEVLHWREWLERHEKRQPFKQAHREIYVLTDAERETATYSNRFAAHILRQHQFAALCRQRGWRYSLEGAWDSANTPYLELPEWGLRVEYWVEGIESGEVSEMGIFVYVATDQVRLTGLSGMLPTSLVDVPPLVFSEVMRDVDLFVGVASVGNDPDWAEGGPTGHHRDYWQMFAFGDLSQSACTRREVLQRVVPRLSIADRCSFDDKFLVVRGDLRTYRIHMGSGNVLMAPNNKYLCIVPRRGGGTKRTDNLFLPFDGDTLLSVIISKAFMLAEDVKIKDESILSQIRC